MGRTGFLSLLGIIPHLAVVQHTEARNPTDVTAELIEAYRYLEVRCFDCDTHQTVALDIGDLQFHHYLPRAVKNRYVGMQPWPYRWDAMER